MRIAIIGSGVSGLGLRPLAPQAPRRRHSSRPTTGPEGTPTPTASSCPTRTCDVDTGFLVYNERTYPLFCRLLDRLGVATQPSDMSFSVSDIGSGLEWRATSPSRRSPNGATRPVPTFWRMLADIGRFNRLARGLLDDPPPTASRLEDVLGPAPLVRGFRDWYLVPLGSSIWSADPSTFTQIPAATFARFFERHGLFRLRDQPSWRTVTGRVADLHSRPYLRPLQRGGRVRLGTPIDKIRSERDGSRSWVADGVESFDHVIVATHSDQALRMLSDADRVERATLGAHPIPAQPRRHCTPMPG